MLKTIKRQVEKEWDREGDFKEFFGFTYSEYMDRFKGEFSSFPEGHYADGPWQDRCLHKFMPGGNPQNEADVMKLYGSDEWSIILRACPASSDSLEGSYKRFYNWYDVEQNAAFRVLDYFKSLDGLRILDWGCGCPVCTMSMYMHGAILTLADVPSKSAEYWKWRIKKNNLKDLYWIDSTLEADFGAEAYDYIWTSSAIEHTFEPEVYMQKLYKALKPDGVIYIEACWGGGGQHLLYNAKRYGDISFTKFMESFGFKLATKLLGIHSKLDYNINYTPQFYVKG